MVCKMKKIFAYILLLCSSFVQIHAQISLKIDSVIVYSMIEMAEENIITSHWGDGPFIMVYFDLENISDSIFSMRDNNIEIKVEGEKNGAIVDYTIWHSSWNGDWDEIMKPHQKMKTYGGVSLLLYKKPLVYLNWEVIDHFKEFEAIRSSLSVVMTVTNKVLNRISISDVIELGDQIVDKTRWSDYFDESTHD